MLKLIIFLEANVKVEIAQNQQFLNHKSKLNEFYEETIELCNQSAIKLGERIFYITFYH